jgi:hypothetical protein
VVIVAVVTYQRQVNVQVSLEYTGRFTAVIDKLPREVWRMGLTASANDLPPRCSVLTEAVLEFMNLCAGEFLLWRSRYLSWKV